MALIRGSQAIHGVGARVSSAGEDAVRGYASHQKALCKVRSVEESKVRRYTEAQKEQCGGTWSDTQCSAYLS